LPLTAYYLKHEALASPFLILTIVDYHIHLETFNITHFKPSKHVVQQDFCRLGPRRQVFYHLQTSAFGLTYISAAATPLAAKSFKFGVTFGTRTLFITESGEASPNKADGVDCVLNADKIACGKSQGAFNFNELHPFGGAMKPTVGASPNQGWSIGTDNAITWKPAFTKVAFSLSSLDSANKVFAEACSVNGHPDGMFFTAGTAKAYYE
jgi:hypothetical protein